MTKRRMLARTGIAAAGVLALGLMTGCSAGGSDDAGGNDSASTLEQLQESGTITLAVANERPYSWVDDSGEPHGATYDMHKQIFSELGIDNIKVVESDWDGLIPGLKAGRFDVVSAGMSILPDRCAKAAFSSPEIMYTTALMLPEGNPKDLTDLDSVKATNGDVKLAVLAGGIEAGYADSLGIENTVEVSNAQDGMDIVSNGRADAFAMTAISLNWMAEHSKDAGVEVSDAFVQVIDGVEQIGAGGTVFAQGNSDLVDAYNEELAKITGDADTYMSIVGDYGFTKENLPPEDLTTEQLCEGDLG